MTVEKPKPKQLLRPITTGADSATNQSQFLEITCNTLKAREKSRVHGAIAFGFASHWLKNWRESFKPITKRGNRNYIITFDSHLKTALSGSTWWSLDHDTKIWFYQTSWQSLNYHRERFGSLTFRALALRQSESFSFLPTQYHSFFRNWVENH